MTTLVALDIETTGLDTERDAVIEVAAIRFRDDRTEGEWASLVNPGRPLPPFIAQLTGITDAMLAGAPSLPRALAELADFVGQTPVVGHNIKFDLGFLQKRGALRHNDALDTYDLASVLMPSAGRYSLGSLGAALGIPLPATHRALDDARVTQAVFRALLAKALELPLDLLAEIVNQGQETVWGGGVVFEEALKARIREKAGARKPRRTARTAAGTPLFAEQEEFAKPLRPRTDGLKPLDVEELAEMLDTAGAFARRYPNYEHRPQQVHMLRAVARALSEKRHLLVEAGTGTGKSLAYLVPAVHWALQNDERVVISTNTINLQDQLIHKDIPDLKATLGLDVRAAVLKGRSNYLCPRRFESLRRHGPKNAEEMRLLAKLLVWLQVENSTGDRAQVSLSGPGEHAVWARLSAEDEGCTAERCAQMMGGICPFYRAHRAAQAAHLIIINHALLLADVASENRVLPDYRYLIIDEGHHLEAAVTDGLAFEAGRADVERLLKDLGGPRSGLLGQALSNCQAALPPAEGARLEREVERAHEAASAALEAGRQFFESFAAFMAEQREGRPVSEYAQQLRITSGTRAQPSWGETEMAWDQFGETLVPLAGQLARLGQALTDLEHYEIEEREDLALGLASAAHKIERVVQQLNGLVSKPDAQIIYWAQAQPDGEKITLHAAPLQVGPLVEKHIWNAKDSVVLTSATLTTAGEFDYLRSRLNAHDAEELAVGSPFDFEASTLVYVPNDIPEPADKLGHQRAVNDGLIALCRATRGRALVLFTSHSQLKATAQAIRPPLERAGIVVYDQADGSSRHQLLESFRGATREGAVLLGTRSFWEGVDVPGQALSVLVIVKLPFDVPSDPIIAARSETFEQPFSEYTVPEAILRFRQGFGRLIRTKSDRGVVAIFDRRILTKMYGRAFVASLPNCTRREGPLARLPALAVKWIDGG